jgi:glutathione peroxidase
MSSLLRSFSTVRSEGTVGEFAFPTVAKGGKPAGELKLSEFQGKVVLIVNTATACGFAPQFSELEELHQKYKDRGLVVLGVPSNDFGGQEPVAAGDLEVVCRKNHGVSFQLTDKVEIAKSPFFAYAASDKGLGSLAYPRWNFSKVLVGRDGKLATYWTSVTSPKSDKVVKAIEEELKAAA